MLGLSMLWFLGVTVTAAVAVSPFPVPMGTPALDCKIRSLAVSYATFLQPQRTTLSQLVTDALQLQNCPLHVGNHVTVRASARTSANARAAQLRHAARASPEIFVDATHGRDNNSGTITSPLATITAAVTKARAFAPATIVLRAGTYYLRNTVVLTPADSGLTIMNYEDELVEVSGGQPLVTLWKVYKQNPANITLQDGFNNLADCALNATQCPFLGRQPSAQACATACLNSKSFICNSYTWHSVHNSEPWPFQCYGRSDRVWAPFKDLNHTSGQVVPGTNIWTADLSGQIDQPTQFTGLRVNGRRGIRARFPNGDPETQLFPTGWIASDFQWGRPRPHTPATEFNPATPNRSNMVKTFNQYYSGVGGACQGLFDPPAGYWCLDNCPRGNYVARFPANLTYGQDLLKTYPSWKPNQTVVNAFRDGHWFSYVFLVDHYDPQSRVLGWTTLVEFFLC